MNTYLIAFQYQGDDRCENYYRAYCKTDDEDEDWVGITAVNVSDKDYINTDWFNNLEILIDER